VPDLATFGSGSHMVFDHLGVIVPDLLHGREILGGALGIRSWTAEFDDPVNDVYVQFGLCPSGMCYETVAPRSPSSPVRNALRKRVNVLNHVAYRVADLAAEAQRLRQVGFAAIADARPAVAYGQRAIQFFINADLFLLELIEAVEHQHRFFEQAAGLVTAK
jgi:methylmalonyl-CoA/ethylmalonyl-CoA epimerase